MELGFKDLNLENYLEPDEMMRPFVTLDASGTSRPIPQEQWANEMLGVTLSERVPVEVRRLFAVARGAMLYGWFFYPLFTLASEQLLRTAEASIALKCRALGAPRKVSGFFARIEWLREAGLFSEQAASIWHSVRELRNSASHPSDQMILMPGHALSVLARTAQEIDRLYASSSIPTT